MPLKPRNIAHAAQIQAGITGRKRGHEFESDLEKEINQIDEVDNINRPDNYVFRGDPAYAIVGIAKEILGWDRADNVDALALGSLATAEEGKKWMKINNVEVKACKSDILLTLKHDGKDTETIGFSVKQCNNKTPTNAQLYFTTAVAFCRLLRTNGIAVTEKAELSLRQFCGDEGYRPLDKPAIMQNRESDPRRFFWEEIAEEGRLEFEKIFTEKQDEITKLLLQKAYLNDPFIPEGIIHKTKKIEDGPQEFALYTIEELVSLSRKYQGFAKKEYSVRKGQYKDPVGVKHEAPRFGVVQMQRGGQKQHPTQLQFNLEAGYFYKI